MRRLGVLLVLCGGCVRHVPAPSADGFVQLVRAEVSNPQPIDRAMMPEAMKLHFLFVAGFLSEGIPGYFKDNAEVVTDELGASTSMFFPPSGGNLETDAELIRGEVSRLTDELQRPVVLIGHSKGGAGAVLAVLRNPELVSSGRVAHVVSIQGALRGSPLADGIVKSLPIPLLHDAFRGPMTLTREKAEASFRAATPSMTMLDWYQRHVRYVRSSETTGLVSQELALTHAFVATHGSGRNDGLLLEEDQWLPGIGHDLGVLRGDHAAFTVSSPLSNGTSQTRKAFTRALLKQVFVVERE